MADSFVLTDKPYSPAGCVIITGMLDFWDNWLAISLKKNRVTPTRALVDIATKSIFFRLTTFNMASSGFFPIWASTSTFTHTKICFHESEYRTDKWDVLPVKHAHQSFFHDGIKFPLFANCLFDVWYRTVDTYITDYWIPRRGFLSLETLAKMSGE